jgi:putative membrane protein
MSKAAWAVVIILAISVVLVLGASLLLPMAVGPRYGWGYGGMMGPWMMGGVGMVGGLLFVLLVIGGVVWLVQAAGRGGGGPSGGPRVESPLDILKRRYAGGEITKDQYEEMKRELEA